MNNKDFFWVDRFYWTGLEFLSGEKYLFGVELADLDKRTVTAGTNWSDAPMLP